MIHYTTNNESAIKLSFLLEQMGVENNKFFLRLDNEKLLNVDPFSENLTNLEKAMILQEIIHNPWYYFREIVRIPAGGGLTRFEFHRGTLALIWAVLNNISCFLVWPRQTYKTTTMCCIYSYLFYYGSRINKMIFIAHEDGIAKKNLQGVKDIRDNLPEWLNLYDSKKDRDNEKEMHNAQTDNKISCRGPTRNPDSARKAGRGLTTPVQWFDECAFISYVPEMYDSISFAYSQASKSAKANGSPYHQIMTTTAGFLNTEEGKWGYNFLNSCADFTEQFYDMEVETVRTVIKNSSTSNFLNLSFMYFDLGKDENYLEEQKLRLVNSPNPQDTLDREVLNKWKDIDTEHPLGQERIERLNSLVRKPTDYIIVNETYSVRLYVDLDSFDFAKILVGGMDLGGNLKGDFSVLTVVDPSDFSVVAVMRTNSQSTILYALAIISIMQDLFPNMVLFPERNYNGAVIDYIISYLPGAKRRVYHEAEDRPGLFNSKNVRPILFNNILRMMIDEYGDRINDQTIITEIAGLIRTRNGRIDHRPGKHDDTLVAWLLAMYFILYVKDVSKYFDKNIILSNYEKNEMVGVARNMNNKISQKLKIIDGMENSYSNITKQIEGGNVSSIDDIGDIIYNARQSTGNIESRVERYAGDDATITEIESSDNLSDVRQSINKNGNGAPRKEVFIENNNNRSQATKNDFQSVFGW